MKQLIVFLALIVSSQQLAAQSFDANKMRYIEQHKYWAMDEQIRTGVPAAITLAQGILETGAGSSELCEKANNHFGIKCKKEWTGETYLHDDDRKSECFRKYTSAKESFEDHSNFLRERSHYAPLFSLEITDFKGWCHGLRKAGYATNPQYAPRLIDIIEEYNLQQYTYEAIEISKENNLVAEVVPIKDKEETPQVVKVEPRQEIIKQPTSETSPHSIPVRKVVYDKLSEKNGRSGFWARKGDYLLPEAVKYSIRYAKLLDINDLNDEPLAEDMFIYLKRKAKKGDKMFYRVKEGETMHSISQNTGVILKYLYAYNNMYDGEEPAAGEKIYLQGRTDLTPKLVNSSRGEQLIANKVEQDDAEEAALSEREENIRLVKEREIEELAAAKEKATQEAIAQEAERKAAAALETERKAEQIAAQELQEEQERRAREAAVIAENKKIVQQEETVIKVVKENVDEPRTTTKHVVRLKEESPITDLDKAKKIERLLGDGTTEVEQIYKKNLEVMKPEKETLIGEIVETAPIKNKEVKIIPAPALESKEVIKEKEAKNAAKQKKVRNYDDDNVSEDVKDLKKKFDTLIYDEE